MTQTPKEAAAAKVTDEAVVVAEKVTDEAVVVAEKVADEAAHVAVSLVTEAATVAAALALAAGTTRSALTWIRVALAGIGVAVLLLAVLFVASVSERDQFRESICASVSSVADATEAYLTEALAESGAAPEDVEARVARYRFFIDPAVADCGTLNK